MKKMRITVDAISVLAELAETQSATAIWDSLPLECRVNTWGEEIYFEIPVTCPLDETAQEVVEKGDLGYWPTGKAFCIFFGPTPASRGDEIRPASAVNIVGKITEDAGVFRNVQDGSSLTLERME